jgi:hypothetical protein
MQLTTEQRVFILEQFYVTASPTKVKRAYVNKINKYRVNINLKTIDNGFDMQMPSFNQISNHDAKLQSSNLVVIL